MSSNNRQELRICILSMMIGIVAATLSSCDRERFPPSNDEKLEHQEKVKKKYDVPTNPDNDESKVNKVKN